MPGVTSTGYEIQTLAEIRAEIVAAVRASPQFGPNADVSATSALGQIIDVFAERERLLQEQGLANYQAHYIDSATGQSLRYVAAITGTIARQAVKSQVDVILNLDDGVTLSVGTRAAVSGSPDLQYELLEEATNNTGSTANISATMFAVSAGAATFAAAGTLTVKVDDQTGWNSVTNAADSTSGEDAETDAELRSRQVNELTLAGSGTVAAIRAAVSAVPTVQSVSVLENVTLSTDSNGVPAKSFEVVALSNPATGDEQAIRDAILGEKPAGIRSFGSDLGTATDSEGTSYQIDFSRPTARPIYLDYTLTTNSEYPGDAAFKLAVVQAATAFFGLGDDVIRAKLIDLAFGVVGVVDVTLLELGFSASPGGTTNLSIGPRDLPTFDTANVVIV